MDTIDAVIRSINRTLVPQFEEQLRTALASRDRDWLVEQIVRLALDAHSLEEMDRKQVQAANLRARAERIERVRALRLDATGLRRFLDDQTVHQRDALIARGYLDASAPEKGTSLIRADHRSAAGEGLLQLAKDVLFALLFGDASTNTHLDRIHRELLTFALPRFKSAALDFMKASTEFAAAGTWQDPDSVSNDSRADNVILEVEYGEVEGELVGHGVVRCLSIINNLEVNEQILYARMIDIEQTTLIE